MKALELAARARIVWEGNVCQVPSQSGNGQYKVERKADGYSCTCQDFELHQKPCKHILAAQFVWERTGGGQAPAVDTETPPVRKTYTQNWPAYTLAQTTEKHRFQVLLHDLCRGLPELPYKKGRPRNPMSDMVFAVVFKVYSTFSARRFMCDLKDAHEKGYLSKPVHHNSLNAYMEDTALTPILHDLIVRASLPLKAVETVFAPDSTGFSTSRFVRWFDEKYGVTRSGHDWVKAHAICGVKTNIITAVRIEGRDVNDSPQFKPLVEATAENFTVKEVPADKAYLSNDNLELIEKLGGTAYVPFKTNSVPGEAGTLWEKMFFYYNFQREEFLKHYHQRSNAESTFNMVKAKFRDQVRSRTETAMKNEVLCKFLCHNICVVIQSQCELGIEATFWTQDQKAEPKILAFPG